MTNEETLQYLEERINKYAEKITTAANKGDRTAVGELLFYTALRTVMTEGKKVNEEDKDLLSHGILDAINDFLIKAGHVDKKHKFWE